ncbi:hypothetical protein LTR56_013012 [Elasticomyces elasticus]|nr:hypothetical protein LTR56_013012 [Elasticomyces elasticus]KAK3649296.1 hypothetical protein LTR22_013025 [Elasticomyces elasticus]KAK4928171.1 hypothetical protein LTR49_005109 [Elasticomyces elasticus]KAK5765923.1 hypothetical protein LTS12_003930 [Elasticomyces elasticus]
MSSVPGMEQDKLGKLPPEIREWIFGYVFKVKQHAPTATIQQSSITPAPATPRLETAILRINKQYHFEALKVLRGITIRLDLEKVCPIHLPANASAIQQVNASQPFRTIQLRITNPRSDCTAQCAVGSVRNLVNSAMRPLLREVNVIQHVYRRPGFYTALVNSLRAANTTIRFPKVGCLSSTVVRGNHFPNIEVNFVWPAIYKAFDIMSGMDRREVEKMQQIHRYMEGDPSPAIEEMCMEHPAIVRRLAHVLTRYYGNLGDDDEGAVWSDTVHTDLEREQITAYAIVGFVVGSNWVRDD